MSPRYPIRYKVFPWKWKRPVFDRYGYSPGTLSLHQPNANSTTNHDLTGPSGPLFCDRLNINVTFYGYTNVFTNKNPVRTLVRIGEQTLAGQMGIGGFNSDSPVPGGRFQILRNYLELSVATLPPPTLRRLKFNDVSAMFECMDSYISMWPDRRGIGGAEFELSSSDPWDISIPFARGIFASRWSEQ